jgi:glycine dehydrogenase subunit 1
MATVYLATMGKQGVQEVARQNLQKAHYAASEIAKVNGYEVKFTAPFFNEFVVRAQRPATEVMNALLDKRIIGGIALEPYYPEMSDSALVCVTETTKKEAIDELVDALSAI